MKRTHTKTTFLLDEGLRRRLKATAARAGRSMTDLLVEGAGVVLDRYERGASQDELARRARAARERLRAGLYKGPGISDRVDELLYAAEPPTRYGR